MAYIIWELSKSIVGLAWTGSVGVYRYFYPSQQDLNQAELLERIRNIEKNISLKKCFRCKLELQEGSECLIMADGICHKACLDNLN